MIIINLLNVLDILFGNDFISKNFKKPNVNTVL